MPVETRIGKPQRHRDKWRCLVTVHTDVASKRTWAPCGASPEAAETEAAEYARGAAAAAVTIREAIEQWLRQRAEEGARPVSIVNYRKATEQFFAGHQDGLLCDLTPKRAQAMYAALCRRPHQRTGEPLAAQTHQSYLQHSKTFAAWAVEAGHIPRSPLENVERIGQPNRGKAQLRIDESRRFAAHALREAARGHNGALFALMALLLGLRVGEVLSRTVRDLDDDGKVLWIEDVAGFTLKTATSRRRVVVPAALRQLLLRRAANAGSAASLLANPAGRQYSVSWAGRAVHQLCDRAGVPRVCAHSLRGLHATLAMEAGATSEAVAAALGHSSDTMTLRHYAAPGSQRAQQGRKVADLLAPKV